jgi:energy-converting hydrogenase Eha subunit C
VFYLDIAYVAMAIHVCCKYIFQMFQLFHLNAACFYLDVAHVAVAICVYCKCIQMFHMFHTYVASVFI